MSEAEKLLAKKIREMSERRSNSPDGFVRSAEAEEKINVICRNALNSPSGQLLMDYIKSISVNVIEDPSATDAQLRDREGMRRMCAILDARRNTKPQPKE